MKRAIGNMSQEPRFSPSHGVCPFSCVIFMCLFTQLCVMCGFWRFSLVLSPMGFPGGSMVKNLPANAGDAGSTRGSGSSLGEGNGYPLQYSCLENSMDRGAWQTTVHGSKELDTTKQVTLSLHFLKAMKAVYCKKFPLFAFLAIFPSRLWRWNRFFPPPAPPFPSLLPECWAKPGD